jgi:hypothetical protein
VKTKERNRKRRRIGSEWVKNSKTDKFAFCRRTKTEKKKEINITKTSAIPKKNLYFAVLFIFKIFIKVVNFLNFSH